MNRMDAPLSDIRVIEIASFVAVPAAGALLCDLGAEVVKVETPEGELLRHSRPSHMGYQSDCSEAPHFHMDNRGKRSLTLDLTNAAALEALFKLLGTADVVLTNMLPGRLRRFGLDAASLRARFPRLVFASLNGYGEAGDESDTPAFDYTAYWARTGFMDATRDGDAAPPFLRPGTGDHAAALALATGILSALRMREKSGAGQEVAVNLMHIGFYIQGNDAAQVLTTGQDTPRHDRSKPRNPLWNQYRTRDGRWVFLVMIASDAYWPVFCRAAGREDLLEDERYGNAISRYRNSEALSAELRDLFARRTLEEWSELLSQSRLIWAPVRTLLEATRDPQAAANGIFVEVEHPAGAMRSVAPPVRMSAHPMRGQRPAPELGADSEALLREIGLSDAALCAALEAGPRKS